MKHASRVKALTIADSIHFSVQGCKLGKVAYAARFHKKKAPRRSRIMRKLIVSNLVTLDGYYEGPDKSVDSLFANFHEDYSGDQNFDYFNAELLRAADFLLLSRSAFL